MEDKALRGVRWTLLGFFSNRGLMLATTLLLARLLVPSDFGLVAFATLAITLLTHVTSLGIPQAMVVRHDLTERGLGTVLSMVLVLYGASAVILALGSPLVAELFGDSRVRGVLLALSVPVAFNGLSTFYWAVLQRELEFGRHFACQVASTATYAGVAITLALLDAGVWSIVAGQIASSVVYTAAVVLAAPWRVRPSFDRAQARQIWISGRGFLMQGGFSFVQQNTDYFIVGSALGSSALGFYSMAYKLSELPNDALGEPVAEVTFPGFARMHHRSQEIKEPFLRVLRLVALVVCPLGVLLAAAADPFVHAVLGDKWLAMIGPLSVLGIWGAIRPVQATIAWMLNSTGHAGRIGSVYGVVLILTIPLLVLAVNLGGLTAVSWVMVGDITIALVAVTAITHRRTGIEVASVARAVRPVAVACPVAWAVAWGVSRALDPAPAIIALCASAAAGAIAYLTVVTWSDPGVIRMARTEIGRALRRRPDGSSYAPDADRQLEDQAIEAGAVTGGSARYGRESHL